MEYRITTLSGFFRVEQRENGFLSEDFWKVAVDPISGGPAVYFGLESAQQTLENLKTGWRPIDI